jgi:hypothetical protein
MSRQKRLFSTIFLIFTVALVVLPFMVSFNDVLTRVVEGNGLYRWVQLTIVPIEAKLMGALLMPLGYEYAFSPASSAIVVNGSGMRLTWNCLGWQSFLFLLITFLVGFRGRFTKLSMLEAVGIGVLGTFWLNIIRMLLTVLLAVHLPVVFRIVFHDYLAAGASILWLFVFWWFSFAYVLVERELAPKTSVAR